ncbi:NlpC/P60 family protein [Oceanobacillus limi]|uniref:NlpC/P60 family protein n=1 Tax=Oceanobacillus limi TaxID=930131 RepID=A0A1I0G4G9_9BACI|nr:C40 family peptidase [Oceanobacillus limi]SET65644.1 NlpC/P60 family protein [Oceanobacillus limi]
MFKQTFDQFHNMQEIWVTAVQVATVWTAPDKAREIDLAGLRNPTNIEQWLEQLTYENRLALCDENRVQSQLLYGEAVIVTEIIEEWAHVVIPSQPSSKDGRGYPGWVPVKQLKKIERNDWYRAKTAAVTDSKVWLEAANGDRHMQVSYMTCLPVINKIADRIKVNTPDGAYFLPGESVTIFHTNKGRTESGSGEDIVQSSKQFLGLDYFWGGMSAFGFDCSGFAYAIHKANGYQIPRDASDQEKDGVDIPLDAVLPGDLLFFAYQEGKGRVHHVGIAIGDDQMIHAPNTGKSIEVSNLKNTVYEKECCRARRYWKWR